MFKDLPQSLIDAVVQVQMDSELKEVKFLPAYKQLDSVEKSQVDSLARTAKADEMVVLDVMNRSFKLIKRKEFDEDTHAAITESTLAETYTYETIAKRLVAKGISRKTHSDKEIVSAIGKELQADPYFRPRARYLMNEPDFIPDVIAALKYVKESADYDQEDDGGEEDDSVDKEVETKAHGGDPQLGEGPGNRASSLLLRMKPDKERTQKAKKPVAKESIDIKIINFMLESDEAEAAVKKELERLGKSLGDLSPEEKKELFNKVDRQIDAKDESISKKSKRRSKPIGESVASPEPYSAVGARHNGSYVKHADVIFDYHSVGGVVKAGYRVMYYQPNVHEQAAGALKIFPCCDNEPAYSLEELSDMCSSLGETVEGACQYAISLAMNKPYQYPQYQGNEEGEY